MRIGKCSLRARPKLRLADHRQSLASVFLGEIHGANRIQFTYKCVASAVAATARRAPASQVSPRRDDGVDDDGGRHEGSVTITLLL